MAEEGNINPGNLEVASTSSAPGHFRLVIKPGHQDMLSTVRDVWRYRELFLFLVWRDISVKYRQTILGASWVILQPLFSMIVFTVVFNRMVGIESGKVPYPLFVLAGVIAWNFFAGSLSRAGDSLVGNQSLITKVYFPRVIIPGSAALAGVVDFVISLLVLAGMMVYYKTVPGLEILMLPVMAILTLFLSFNIGMFAAAGNIRFRDVKYVLDFAVRILFFLTPVVYPYSKIPENYRVLAALNPMVGIIEGFRWSLFSRHAPNMEFPHTPLLVSCLITLAAFLAAQGYFRRVERTFADVV